METQGIPGAAAAGAATEAQRRYEVRLGSKVSVLSGVTTGLFIEDILDQLMSAISPASSRIVGYESSDLAMNETQVYVRGADGEYSPLAQFAHRDDAATFMVNNSARAKTTADLQLSTLRKFMRARSENNVAAQRELFEGVYIITAMHLGEATARSLRAAFLSSANLNHLQLMANAVISGANGSPEIIDHRDSPDSSVEQRGPVAARAAHSLRFLFRSAGEDAFQRELHTVVERSLRDHAEALRGSGHTDDADDITRVVDILRSMVILPGDVETFEAETTYGLSPST